MADAVKRTAVVTGASSGIGWAVCEMLLERGWRVYGLSRRGTGPDGVTGLSVRLTDEASMRRIMDAIAEKGKPKKTPLFQPGDQGHHQS